MKQQSKRRLCGLVVSTTDSYTCSRWFESYLTCIFSSSFIFIFFVGFGAIRPRQQIFSHIGTISCFHGKHWVTKVTPPVFHNTQVGLRIQGPVLVEICSRNSFYGQPFPSVVSIRAAIFFMKKCEHSILMFPVTVCVGRLTNFCLLE